MPTFRLHWQCTLVIFLCANHLACKLRPTQQSMVVVSVNIERRIFASQKQSLSASCLQARELARRLGPLAGKFPRSLRTAVRLHRVPKDLEGEVWCEHFSATSSVMFIRLLLQQLLGLACGRLSLEIGHVAQLLRALVTPFWRMQCGMVALHRLLADEVEPAVRKAQETIDKLPEAARKVSTGLHV